MDDSPSYFAVATIVKRLGGLHEPLGWMTRRAKHAWYHRQAIDYLMGLGLRVAWTFEKDKVHLYERILRPVGKLRILKTFMKRYNNQDIEFCYGEILKT